MENADDIRLSVRLFSKCLKEKKAFCGEVAPGGAKVKDCLEDNRNKDSFSADCKEEVDAMIERRVRDFRLDSRLRTVCESDIYSMCAFFGVGAAASKQPTQPLTLTNSTNSTQLLQDLDGMEGGDDASVIRCLQDYVNEIQSAPCKEQVQKYQQLAAESIRFDVPLADACFDDRQKLCASVPPVRAAAPLLNGGGG